jgi:PAS domain-containing protein
MPTPQRPPNPRAQRPRQIRQFQGSTDSEPELLLPAALVHNPQQPSPQMPGQSPGTARPGGQNPNFQTGTQANAGYTAAAQAGSGGAPARQALAPQQPTAQVLTSQHILNTANAAISHFRITERYTYCCDYCSPGSEAILGYSLAELKQKPQLWRSQIWEADWEAVVKPAMKKLLRITQADPQRYYKSQFEFRFQRKSGFPGWMSTTLSCRYDTQTHLWYLTMLQIEVPAIDMQRRVMPQQTRSTAGQTQVSTPVLANRGQSGQTVPSQAIPRSNPIPSSHIPSGNGHNTRAQSGFGVSAN